jgi:hypothetical protein
MQFKMIIFEYNHVFLKEVMRDDYQLMFGSSVSYDVYIIMVFIKIG